MAVDLTGVAPFNSPTLTPGPGEGAPAFTASWDRYPGAQLYGINYGSGVRTVSITAERLGFGKMTFAWPDLSGVPGWNPSWNPSWNPAWDASFDSSVYAETGSADIIRPRPVGSSRDGPEITYAAKSFGHSSPAAVRARPVRGATQWPGRLPWTH